jgi:hypothetical protein
MCISVCTVHLVTKDANAGDATVMYIQVAAWLVSKVGELPLFRTHSSCSNRRVSIRVPRQFEDGEPHTSL